jgi:carbonic anhydrase
MDLIYRYDPEQPVGRKTFADASSALQALTEGNARFADFVARMHQETLGHAVDGQLVIPVCPMSLGLPAEVNAVPTQAPFALVLGCSDARVPAEVIFDRWFNDLFIVRIAGNVLGVECLGSVDYAVRHFGSSLKLIVVLGHTGCGAVTAAVDTYLNPRDYVEIVSTHALRSLIDRILIAVRAAAKNLERELGPEIAQHPNYRAALIEMAIYVNVAVTAFDLKREVRALENSDIRVVYGVYDLASLRIRSELVDPRNGSDTPRPFMEAPEKAEDFRVVGLRLARLIAARAGLIQAPAPG